MKEQETIEDTSPLDSIISTLKEYIADPKLVTAETLQALLTEVEAVKADVEGEEAEEVEEGGEESPSLAIMIGKKMKKALYLLAFLPAIGWCANPQLMPKSLPNVNVNTSEALYVSSAVYGETLSPLAAAVTISSVSCRLYSIVISSYGSNSTLRLYNLQRTTTTAQAMIFPPLDTSAGSRTESQTIWNVWCSSGLLIDNRGTPAAQLTIIYRNEKKD